MRLSTEQNKGMVCVCLVGGCWGGLGWTEHGAGGGVGWGEGFGIEGSLETLNIWELPSLAVSELSSKALLPPKWALEKMARNARVKLTVLLALSLRISCFIRDCP